MSAIEFNEADHSVFDLLGWIRKRPQAFLDGDYSLKRLRSFLVGYECGLGRVHFAMRGRVVFCDFNDWVAAQLGYTNSTSGWCNMITAKAGSDQKAYDLFFDLLDNFCKEKGIGGIDGNRH